MENTKIRTHYDNLKVARNAPSEIIRAAYKTLSQKYHPDRNPHNSDASRIMAIINASYEELSDPGKRKQHDLWIAEQESSSIPPNIASQKTPPADTSYTSTFKDTKRNPQHLSRYWILYIMAAFVIWVMTNQKPSPAVTSPKPYVENPVSEIKTFPLTESLNETKTKKFEPTPAPKIEPELTPSAYVRPLYAPNGKVWPSTADYVPGYEQLNMLGLSTVTVDNSQNDSDVFVKLISLNDTEAYPIRQFFIPAYGKFTVNEVTTGSYDVRYRDLNNGSLSRSEAFNLEETEIAGDTQPINYTMTLYKVRNGNMQTYDLSEAEF